MAPLCPRAASGADGLIAALTGPNAHAEYVASQKLVAMGDAAVPALTKLVRTGRNVPPRLVAVELLGKIGTIPARDALIALLKAEKNLAVRSQLCMQLGALRESRAVPVLAAWLETIGPRAIHDVRGPKEVQPSTCYIRHLEALTMIGDPAVIPDIEAFKKRIPQRVGYGGFLTHFVTRGADDAIAALRERAAFLKAVRAHPGLAKAAKLLFDHLHTDRVARFRQHADEIVRGTAQGRKILERLSGRKDKRLAASAKALLAKFGALNLSGEGAK